MRTTFKKTYALSFMMGAALLGATINVSAMDRDNPQGGRPVLRLFVGEGNLAQGITRRPEAPCLDPHKIAEFHDAASVGDLPTMERLLNERVDVNACPKNTTTPLITAIESRQLAAIQMLVARGACLNSSSPEYIPFLPRLNPLGMASGAPEVFALLVRLGADVNGQAYDYDRLGESILSLETKACRWVNVSCLVEAGANVNAIPFHGGDTALALAAMAGEVEGLQIMLPRATPRNKQTSMASTQSGSSKTILHWPRRTKTRNSRDSRLCWLS